MAIDTKTCRMLKWNIIQKIYENDICLRGCHVISLAMKAKELYHNITLRSDRCNRLTHRFIEHVTSTHIHTFFESRLNFHFHSIYRIAMSCG